MNEQTGSVVLADIIAEFLEVAFHMIIFICGIYPPAELLKDTIHRICVVTLDSSTRPVDRFVFEMSVFKSFEDRLQIVQQPPQQNAVITHGNDNNQLEQVDEDPNILYQGQDQQSETAAPRFDKGKGKAIEYQRHEMEENDVVDDEDVEVDGGVEKGQYGGYGGDHEQEPEPEQDEQGHHVTVEGEEGEGYDEEEYDEEDDDEAPL
ncbi:hypothetical protein BGZ96_000316, partial [Linnemannia gamsii]